jgi:hypothetical protein
MDTSANIIKCYLSYGDDAKDPDSTEFVVFDDLVIIYQVTDESDQDGEGPDKYFVSRAEVDEELWNTFINWINS